MYYVSFSQSEEIICEDFDRVMELIVAGWKFYWILLHQTVKQESLLHECKPY